MPREKVSSRQMAVQQQLKMIHLRRRLSVREGDGDRVRMKPSGRAVSPWKDSQTSQYSPYDKGRRGEVEERAIKATSNELRFALPFSSCALVSLTSFVVLLWSLLSILGSFFLPWAKVRI